MREKWFCIEKFSQQEIQNVFHLFWFMGWADNLLHGLCF